MKVSKLLEVRRANWQELEAYCARMETPGAATMPGDAYVRFAALYRSTCADLALADAYQLPPNTTHYLHQLTGRAHNQLYRNKSIDIGAALNTLFFEVPQAVFRDRCVHVAFILFWGIFILSAYVAYRKDVFPRYAEQMLGRAQLDQLEQNFGTPLNGRNANENYLMAGFYIWHNTGIGLACFATGLLIVPGLVTLVFNSAVLGASFGYMSRPELASQGKNFFEFVRGHGPFELTAIALSAGAGLRLGVSIISTGGLTRLHSLQKSAKEALPVMASAGMLFFGAALIEGFLSPSGAGIWVKTAVMGISTALLLFYFVVLGFPREASVQLDSTRIAIRERSMLEILDLALHVLRMYGGALTTVLFVNVFPFALLNALLIGRVAEHDYSEGSVNEYLYFMALLVFVEAQWATSLVTLYLGKAVFLAEPTWGEIWADFREMFWQLLWVHGVVRLVIPVLVVTWFVERGSDFFPFGHAMLAVGALVAILVRAWRPYITEVVLLERNPLWSWEQDAMTVGRRSSLLHDPNGGELFARWLGIAVLCITVGTSLVLTARTTLGIFFNHWGWGPVALHFVYPLVLWLVAGYVAVVRFLSYLDLRIRREGWEIELKMRAESARMTKSWI